VLAVTTVPSAWRGSWRLVQNERRIRLALGFHPQLAQERIGELSMFDEILPDAPYVGEIGLDGAPEFRKHFLQQMHVFEHLLKTIQRTGGRVMSIHSRRASGEVLNVLARYPGAGIPVLHWFSGGMRDLERAVSLGCWFSVGPPMLLGNRGKTLVVRMPRNRVLTETDGPFVQSKGQSLMPWHVSELISQLAIIWGVSNQEAGQMLTGNLRSLLRAFGSKDTFDLGT